ncbi:hypothetical protein QKT49_gp303 [Acanthamoeba castellanii medusavirus]|uniref:Uncharacterized protein n=1 Tax=Acanthamoeba castellanii medusavirus J1 TaxID=3114988 RepID=A0A3T1CX99_9VIRU|nr:hypothetical protein QKT49_gp303 [Acanthamoeba castellanii medusavirus]BBI30460.1 hypothetical protein [Acanthamoeba castellanii medusavirus J1]
MTTFAVDDYYWLDVPTRCESCDAKTTEALALHPSCDLNGHALVVCRPCFAQLDIAISAAHGVYADVAALLD